MSLSIEQKVHIPSFVHMPVKGFLPLHYAVLFPVAFFSAVAAHPYILPAYPQLGPQPFLNIPVLSSVHVYSRKQLLLQKKM
jgi:hypothetical protein